LRGKLQIQMLELLKEFGKDVLFVTHSKNEAFKLCKFIALIDDGRIIAHKETEQLFSIPESRQVAILTGCKHCGFAIEDDYN